MGIKGMKWNVRKNNTTELDNILKDIRNRQHDLMCKIAWEAEQKGNYDLLNAVNDEYDFLNELEAKLRNIQK